VSRRNPGTRAVPVTVPAAEPASTRPTPGFWPVCLVALVLCTVLKVPALIYPPDEADEQIHWQLAVSLAQRGEYTLRGSALLPSLSPYIYDRPLFHHPPLYPALLVPFVRAEVQPAAVLVSWLGHLLAVFAVALIGRHALRQQPGSEVTAASPRFWLPVMGVAADPLLMFVSKRLWIDGLLAGLVALGMAILLHADGRRRRSVLALAGLVLGLAALAKLTALLLAPLFLVIAVKTDTNWRARARSALAVGLPVVVLVVPWLLAFHAASGVFIASWIRPDARSLELFPFLRTVVERPWYYYVTTLISIMPLALVAAWVLTRRTAWQHFDMQVVAGWFGLYVLAQTLLGLDGYGFQMRHIAPAVAAVYAVVLLALIECERAMLMLAAAVAIVIGAVTGAMHLLAPQFDEMTSIPMIAWLLLS
jgi:4-amino-4-deoxy-L-arabinose transferase-like glycosyltransferase